MKDDKFWCPRRVENGAMPGPNGEPPRFFPEGDHWFAPYELHPNSGEPLPYSRRSCSYCGSWHPDDLFAYLEDEGEVGPTDKNYKIYLKRSPDKFYFQHFSEDEKRRFVDMLNAREIRFGSPGYFYVKPFFVGTVK